MLDHFRIGSIRVDRATSVACRLHPQLPTYRCGAATDVMGHVWTAPAVQEESDVSAKRSGAAMYPACFRLEDCLCRDAAAVAAGPDVIR